MARIIPPEISILDDRDEPGIKFQLGYGVFIYLYIYGQIQVKSSILINIKKTQAMSGAKAFSKSS